MVSAGQCWVCYRCLTHQLQPCWVFLFIYQHCIGVPLSHAPAGSRFFVIVFDVPPKRSFIYGAQCEYAYSQSSLSGNDPTDTVHLTHWIQGDVFFYFPVLIRSALLIVASSCTGHGYHLALTVLTGVVEVWFLERPRAKPWLTENIPQRITSKPLIRMFKSSTLIFIKACKVV